MNLKTKYLGMQLRTPLVASASPLTSNIDSIKKLEDAGASALVLHSLFEEQLRMEQEEVFYHTTFGVNSFAEAQSFFPEPDEYRLGAEQYLGLISKAKSSVGIPVIASLNGTTDGGWTEFAKKMQEAGADAIELNIYNIPTAMDIYGEDIEEEYIDIFESVKSSVSIPVAIKLSPFFSNMANMARRFDDAGANALVLFNRFLQPDIDLETLNVEPHASLSHSSVGRLPMRWIAILKHRIVADLAATSGISTGEDVVKMLLVGAKVTMLCSSLLKNGAAHIKTIEKELIEWLEKKEYSSVEDIQGILSQVKLGKPGVFERAQYMKALTTYKY
jgi:dihydroorotate dehydrogenase (fumarate)